MIWPGQGIAEEEEQPYFGHFPNGGGGLPKLILILFLKVEKMPKLCAGGGLIWAIPKKKSFFSFPSTDNIELYVVQCTQFMATFHIHGDYLSSFDLRSTIF